MSRLIQLDRIDVLGHYTADNCRLTNIQVNTRNRKVAVVGIIQSAEGEIIDLKDDNGMVEISLDEKEKISLLKNN